MEVEELRGIELFTGLTDDQLAELATGGDEVPFETADVLFTEGDHADEWWVLLSGSLDLVRKVGREDVVVARMDVPGRWAGGFRAWDDNGIYLATGRGATPGRVLRLDAPAPSRAGEPLVPAGGAPDGRASPHGPVDRVHGAAARRPGHAGHARSGSRARDQQPRGRREPHGRRPRSAAATRCSRRSPGSPATTSRRRSSRRSTRCAARRVRSAPLDALALADRESELATWLQSHGMADPWGLSSGLAAGGIDRDWCERVHEAIGDEALGPGLEWVSATISSKSLLTELKDAVRRISELVAAVRSYSQLDRASRQRVDVREGLDSTLTMLGHKLRGGVTVLREYDELPAIDAFAGELNQVWTNLVDNAVDAMDGQGTLTVRTRAEGDWIVVEIADTGSGMSPEVAARAFEPFFTTKDVGQGTGLGLDIARRIVVERHGGTIVVESGPDRPGTTIVVTLPVRSGRVTGLSAGRRRPWSVTAGRRPGGRRPWSAGSRPSRRARR